MPARNATTRSALILLVAGGIVALAPSTGSARQFPTFAGGDLAAGAVWPHDAGSTIAPRLDLDLGEFLPGLRTFAGLHRFRAPVERIILDQRISGDVAATGLRAGGRIEPLGAGRFAPYVSVAVTIYNVGTEADDAEHDRILDDVYGGVVLGASAAAGAVYPLEATGQVLAFLEVRRTVVSNVGHHAADIGVRLRLLRR